MSSSLYRQSIFNQGLEAAVRQLHRQRTRDTLRMSRLFGLLPGPPVAGGELRRAALEARASG